MVICTFYQLCFSHSPNALPCLFTFGAFDVLAFNSTVKQNRDLDGAAAEGHLLRIPVASPLSPLFFHQSIRSAEIHIVALRGGI